MFIGQSNYLMADNFFEGTDKPEQIERDLINELVKALSHSAHSFRYPCLITAAKNFPQGRTMVLRAIDESNKRLYFYTDKRSDKVAQIEQSSRVGLHFYHHGKKLQIRLGGEMAILETGEKWQAHFEKVPSWRYGEYATLKEPGEIISSANEEYEVAESKARENFVLLEFSLQKMEALQLSGKHHFRIQFDYQGGNFNSQWLQP